MLRKYLVLFPLLAVAASLPLQKANSSSFNPRNIDFDFESKIVKASEQGNVDILKSLLSQGGDPNERGKFEATALHRAAYNNNVPITNLLIKNEVDVSAQDFGGATPLHVAAREGASNVAKLLIKNNAVIDIKDNEGYTPLHRAIIANRAAISITLLEAGANVNTVAKSGDTPIIDAARKGNYKLVEELIAKGADKERQNNKGYSAFDYANKVGSDVTIESLQKTKSSILRERAVDKNPVIIVSSDASENEIPAFLLNKVEREKRASMQPAVEIDSLATVSLGKQILNGNGLHTQNNPNEILTAVEDVLSNDLPKIGEEDNASNLLLSANQSSFNKSPVTGSVQVIPLNASARQDSRYVKTSAFKSEKDREVLAEIDPLFEDAPTLEELTNSVQGNKSQQNFSNNTVLVNKPQNYKQTKVSEELYLQQNRAKPRSYNYITENKSLVGSGGIGQNKSRRITGDGFTPMSLAFREYKETNGNIRNIPDIKYKGAAHPQKLAFNSYQQPNLPKSLQIKQALQNKPQQNYYKDVSQIKTQLVNTRPQSKASVSIRKITPTSQLATLNSSEIISEPNYENIDLAPIATQVNKEYKIAKATQVVQPSNAYVQPILEAPAYKAQVSVKPIKLSTAINKTPAQNYSNPILGNMNEFYNDTEYNYASRYDMQNLETKRAANLGLNTLAAYADIKNSYQATQSNNLSKEYNIAAEEPSLALFDQLEAEKASPEPLNSTPTVQVVNERRPVASNPYYNKLQQPKISSANAAIASAVNTRGAPASLAMKTSINQQAYDKMFDNVVLSKRDIKAATSLSPNSDSFTLPIVSDIENRAAADIVNAAPMAEVEVFSMKTLNAPKIVEDKLAEIQPIKKQVKNTVSKAPKLPKVDDISEDLSLDLPDLEDIQKDISNSVTQETAIVENKSVQVANVTANEIDDLELPDLSDITEPAMPVVKKTLVDFDIRGDNNLSGSHAVLGSFETSKEAETYFNQMASRFGVVNNYKIINYKGQYKVAIGKLKNEAQANKLCKIFGSNKVNCSLDKKASGEIMVSKKVYSILGEFKNADEAKNYIKSRSDVELGSTDYQVARAGSSNIYLLQIGPVANGEYAKNICASLKNSGQKCKVAVQ